MCSEACTVDTSLKPEMRAITANDYQRATVDTRSVRACPAHCAKANAEKLLSVQRKTAKFVFNFFENHMETVNVTWRRFQN